MEERRHSDVIREKLPLEGRRVLDVACGDGVLVRFLRSEGASPIGLDSRAAALDAARAEDPEGLYLLGRPQALPFADGSIDAVVFFNSLHMIDPDQHMAVLGEAHRVLVPGGHVFVQEPLAEGDYHELIRVIEDDSTPCERAYQSICAARELRLNAVADIVYDAPVRHDHFENFAERFLALDPGRAGRLAELEPDLRLAFERLGQRRDDGYLFRRPTRVNLLQRL
jgi:ubiquinone/menaquinone biosynthesis C-methylase UbiE